MFVGVVATPWLIELIAPGFTGAKRERTISIVRILFPGAGLLVLSAWCLGVLNSHHKFLLSYAAPIVWSAAMVIALVWFGSRTDLPRLVEILAWSSVVGSALQLAVQIPSVLRAAPDLVFTFDTASDEVRTIVRNFVPAFVGRGAVQISAFVDAILASLLPTGAVAALANAQTLYTLPVSLFGMAISAAELPAMARTVGTDSDGHAALVRRPYSAHRQQWFIVPSAMAFLAPGDVVAAALLQTGRFRHADCTASGASSLARRSGSRRRSGVVRPPTTHSATRGTPVRYAIVRVVLTTVLGYLAAIPLPRLLGIDLLWGAAGLTASAGIAGWVEMLLLRRTLNARIGRTGLPTAYVAQLWVAAAIGAAVAWGSKLALPPLHPMLAAVAILGPYGLVFFAVTVAFGIPEARSLLSRLRR